MPTVNSDGSMDYVCVWPSDHQVHDGPFRWIGFPAGRGLWKTEDRGRRWVNVDDPSLVFSGVQFKSPCGEYSMHVDDLPGSGYSYPEPEAPLDSDGDGSPDDYDPDPNDPNVR